MAYIIPNQLPLKTLVKNKANKSVIFKECFVPQEISFDVALPQNWLDAFAEWCSEHQPEVTYHLILSTTVWAYPPTFIFGTPITICSEVQDALYAWRSFPSVLGVTS